MDIDTLLPQSTIKVMTATTSFKGVLLPSEGSEIVLKLDSGYNVGLLKRNIVSFDVISETITEDIVKTEKVSQNNNLPEVMVLHTGGTIASKVDYATGGVIAQFDPDELLGLFPELRDVAFIKSTLIGNMQSDDFRFDNFNTIAKSVLEHAKKGTKKFIVTSGTDFLHYLSAALSFMLKDVPVGVVVVGAQRSSDRGSSDAGMNLACAATFLSQTEFTGVGVCMHESINDDICSIIPGVATRKLHSSRRDAFKPVNTGVFASVDYKEKKVSLLGDIPVQDGAVPDSVPLFKEDVKIGLLYGHPNMFPEEVKAYNKFDGLVLIGSGLGHFPVDASVSSLHGDILSAITSFAKKKPVVMALQTIFGKVHMNVYSPGRTLQEAGVIGHGSVMSAETSFVKLAFLLSNHPVEDVKMLFMQDLVGEMHGDDSNLYY